MNVSEFHERLKELIGEVEMSNDNTPTEAIASTLFSEATRLKESKTRFMHELLNTY